MSDSLVLCYHAISPSWTAPLSVTAEAFERQLAWLVRHGWRGVRFSDILNKTTGRTFAVTFDDAFASVFELARPIMAALGIPGTAFAPTSFLQQRSMLSWPGIDHWTDTPFAHELECMSWSDLGTLAQEGWEIGSHTRTHPHLTQLDDESLRNELRASRSEIEAQLPGRCTTIAYPYGDVDERVAEEAGAAGYVAGAELSRALVQLGPLRRPRIGIYRGDDFFRFRLKVSRPLRRVRASRRWLPS